MNRNETITEIACVFIDALGKQIEPDDPALLHAINEACKARRLGHTDRYHNTIADVAKILRLETPEEVESAQRGTGGVR